MLEKLLQSAPLNWLRTKNAAAQDEDEAGGAERVYRPNRTTPPALLVSLTIIIGIAVVPVVVTPAGGRNDEIGVIVATFVVMAFFNAMLIVFAHWFPFFFRHPLDEVRIRGRVVTVRHRWKERSFWLGDAARLVWALKDGPPRVYLFSVDGEFVIPLQTLRRADSVELFEWLRWGCPVKDEYWPEFCHRIAVPRRGPIDRPLRACERRVTRKSRDLLVAEAAAAMAIASGGGALWTGELRWLAILWLVPVLWMWRFAIPQEGQIVVSNRWRSLYPGARKTLALMGAIVAALAVSSALLIAGLLPDWAILLVVLCGVLPFVLMSYGFIKKQTEFAAESPQDWVVSAMSAWKAEAKTGVWSLGRGRK